MPVLSWSKPHEIFLLSPHHKLAWIAYLRGIRGFYELYRFLDRIGRFIADRAQSWLADTVPKGDLYLKLAGV